ncbi:tryptophan--tRNA ligase [Patescibacteria group bacterium]
MKVFLAPEVTKKYPSLEIFYTVLETKNLRLAEVYFARSLEKKFLGKYDLFFQKTCQAEEQASFFKLVDQFGNKSKLALSGIEGLVRKFSLEYGIPLTVFSGDGVKGDLVIRFSTAGEVIESQKDVVEQVGKERVILSDKERVVAILGLKGTQGQKIAKKTVKVILLGLALDKTTAEQTRQAMFRVGNYLEQMVKLSKPVSGKPDFGRPRKKRVISGIRPSGQLHLGNYLGAIEGMVRLQNSGKYEAFYMVANLSGITTPYDRGLMPDLIKNVILDYLAAGIDPQRSTIFLQSAVSGHAELCFLLSSLISLAKLKQLPTYKEKVKQFPGRVNLALLSYPVLMAAGILLYRAHYVPVGEDQEPHLALTRKIASKLNSVYGTSFPIPKRLTSRGKLVPSLLGQGKMSKSVAGSYIALSDNYQEIKTKIRAVPTATIVGGEMPAGVRGLFNLLNLCSSEDCQRLERKYDRGTLKYIDLKDILIEHVYKLVRPLQKRRKVFSQRDEYIKEILKKGALKADKIASLTVAELKVKMGLVV